MSDLPVLSLEFIRPGILNLTVIIALLLVYYFIPDDRLSRSKFPYPLWIGILFGAIAAISSPFIWAGPAAPVTGFNIVLVPLAAVLAGPLAAALVAAPIILMSTAVTGTVQVIVVIPLLCMILLGSFVSYLRSRIWFPRTSFIQLLILGLGVALIELFVFLFAPVPAAFPYPAPGLPQVLVFLPFLLLICLSTIILGSLIGFIRRKKDVETALALTNKQLSLALEVAKAETWELNLLTGEINYSSRASPRFDYTPEEIPHSIPDLEDLIHPDDREVRKQALDSYLEGKTEIYESLARYRDLRGNWRWQLSRGRAVERDASGRPILLIGVAIDVTERRQAEEKFREAYQQVAFAESELRKHYDELAWNEERTRESEEKYRAVVTWANDGILILQNGVFRFVNPKAAELHGSPAEDLIDRPFITFVHPREKERIEANYRRRMAGEPVPSIYETTIVKKNGDPVDVEVNTGVITFEGRPAELVFIRDITERKRSEKALENAKKKLNLLNYVTFSEIRNQFFSLTGYLQLTRSSINTNDPRVRVMAGKEEELLQKIHDSLRFAQTYQDLGMKPARWQNVKHAFILAISHLDFARIRHHVTTEDLEIFADPLFEQVFQILASNTLIHGTNATHVKIGYLPGADETMIVFFEDDGAGIPETMKEKIFLPEFPQKKAKGLFLAREILEITEISIRETGKPGEGVRFEMTILKGGYRFAGRRE